MPFGLRGDLLRVKTVNNELYKYLSWPEAIVTGFLVFHQGVDESTSHFGINDQVDAEGGDEAKSLNDFEMDWINTYNKVVAYLDQNL